jgi:hypothetical protein
VLALTAFVLIHARHSYALTAVWIFYIFGTLDLRGFGDTVSGVHYGVIGAEGYRVIPNCEALLLASVKSRGKKARVLKAAITHHAALNS